MSYMDFSLQQNFDDILFPSPLTQSITDSNEDSEFYCLTDAMNKDFANIYENTALSVTSPLAQSDTDSNEIESHASNNTINDLSKSYEHMIPVTSSSLAQSDINSNEDLEFQASSNVIHQDSAKMSEHMALLDLLPEGSATHVAVNNGSWFNPDTWKDGVVPDDNADVLISEGVSVFYNKKSDASLHTVRVDGTLKFAHDADTKMVIDTFIVTSEGTLEIGTQNQPIQSDKTVEIIIADNGAIDLKWDSKQLSRGLVSHGKVTMHGMEKTTHLKLELDAMAGDTELLLENVPKNWQIGDRIVLTGTHYVPWGTSSTGAPNRYMGTQDEELQITDIDGKRIILDRPLQYDHDTPNDDLKASVANYSRNITFKTENFENIPNNQRGHVMFMHSNDVDVRYAEFFELGRTDKAKALDDFDLKGGRTSERILDADGNTIPGEQTNIRGRYSFHLHQTGVGYDDKPAVAIGNAVWGSPGWGYVHHDSHAVMNDNAAYDVYGSAFVSETGNETGEWKNNIAIKGEGMWRNIKFGANNQDVGVQGNGFWFQSRMIENVDNIAAGMSGMGVAYFHRGVDTINPQTENLINPEIARYTNTVSDEVPPIALFTENEVFASGKALHIAKLDPKQGHDIRNIVTDFTGWEVQNGIHLEYTRHYTLKDITLLASDKTTQPNAIGVRFGNETEDMTVANFQVDSFNQGIALKEGKDNDSFIFVDGNLANNNRNLVSNTTNISDFITSNSLRQEPLIFEMAADNPMLFRAGKTLTIKGEKLDSFGRGVYMDGEGGDTVTFTNENIANRLANGYYTLEDGMPILTIEVFVSDRLTEDFKEVAIPVRLDGVELSDRLYLGVYDPSANVDGASEDLIVRQTVSYQNSTIVGTSSTDEFLIVPEDMRKQAIIYAFEDEKDKLVIPSENNYQLSDTTITMGATSIDAALVTFSNDEAISLIGITAEDLSNDILSTNS